MSPSRVEALLAAIVSAVTSSSAFLSLGTIEHENGFGPLEEAKTKVKFET